MPLSIFDLFKIGIGPSSSHTIGPMWAASRFLRELEARDQVDQVVRAEAHLYGSLAGADNSIPLIAGKDLVARVYVDTGDDPARPAIEGTDRSIRRLNS